MRRTGLIPLCVALASASPVLAQWQVTGETGASHIKQTGLGEANTATLGASVEAAGARTLFRSSALGAFAGDIRWTGQALAIGAAATPEWRSFQVQGSGALSAFAQTGIPLTTSADALLQVRTGTVARGAAIGAGAGRTSHNDVSLPSTRAVADAWLTARGERFGAEAVLTRTRSVFGESSILVDISRRNVSYLDLGASWRHERAAWSAGLSAGVRGSDGSLAAADRWLSIDVAAWVASRLSVVASGGQTLDDLVRGVPQARYVTLALRVSSQPHATLLGGRVRVSGPRMTIAKQDGGPARIEVSGTSAARVELMGDFTDWNPVVLERDGTAWRIDRVVTAGPHRVAIRLDGGEWIVPANLPRVEDDLGGMVGLVTVP